MDPGLFLGWGALVSCSTSTPINQIVFFLCKTPVVLENYRSSQGGRGCAPPTPSPLDPPLKKLRAWFTRDILDWIQQKLP